MESNLSTGGRTGHVALVGAGPGSADLLTLRALRVLQRADVVVHDGLVGPDVLALAPDHALRIRVAKARDRHTMPQRAIEALLVAHARAGRFVVRLKGGDPFIFGRGGEEVEALRAAGIPHEVVPGVSAALGCAAEAELPLTHRGLASAVTFVAGTCQGLREQDWRGLAGPGRTLVVYMGVTTAAAIADKLIADGVAPDTPVAVLERGTLAGARALRTVLADMGDAVARAGVRSPALMVVGRVAALARAEDLLGPAWADALRAVEAPREASCALSF